METFIAGLKARIDREIKHGGHGQAKLNSALGYPEDAVHTDVPQLAQYLVTLVCYESEQFIH